MKVAHIVPEFVTSFPEQLEPGVLYVSAQFSTAAHTCACGCSREVITPLSPAQWVLTFDGSVSMRPSIGNWALPCQSHYVLDHGAIRWAAPMSKEAIRSNQEADHRTLDDARALGSTWWRRLWASLRRD
jgi:Family of unknown function (DUF6527)